MAPQMRSGSAARPTSNCQQAHLPPSGRTPYPARQSHHSDHRMRGEGSRKVAWMPNVIAADTP